MDFKLPTGGHWTQSQDKMGSSLPFYSVDTVDLSNLKCIGNS